MSLNSVQSFVIENCNGPTIENGLNNVCLHPLSRTFTFYGHECWIMNEKVRSRVQAAEMGFLRRISGLTLLDKIKSADIRESLNMESLLLRLDISQLRWYGHVTRMSQERTASKLLCSTPIGRRARGRPRT